MKTLADKIFQVVEAYEREWQQKLRALEERVEALERENEELQQELESSLSPMEGINDEILRDRLACLGSSPLDTLIREAGVVLEDRLRQVVGDIGSTLYGVKLVDAALSPDGGKLVFSSHPGEQDGVRILFRGAMQFIRNPPMHRLVEYPESMAGVFIRLIDSLLQLLSESTPHRRGEVTVEDIQRMLTRRRVSKGQLALYEALYEAGERGLSSSELAQAMDRDREQVAGVLGALGRRINSTSGLGGKGGVSVVLEITETAEAEWHYRMRQILWKALEAEKLV